MVPSHFEKKFKILIKTKQLNMICECHIEINLNFIALQLKHKGGCWYSTG